MNDDLRAAEERFHLLVDAATDYAIFLLDPSGRIVTWNAGAERIKGYRAEEVIGSHVEMFFPPEDRLGGKPQRNLEAARRDGRFEDEGWRVRKDGSRFWANAILTALRNEAGGIVGFAKVTRDLTERRATHEALRRSEERFRLMVDAMAEYAICMLDPQGRIEAWNTGADKIHGYAASEILGQHFELFFPEDDVRAGKPAEELERALAEGRFQDEGWLIRKNGERFWASVMIAPLRDAEGGHIGFTRVTRDLTERCQAEQIERRLTHEQAARAAAEQASREKDEFLAVVSHELRTPLSAILGWSTMLRERPDHPRGEKALAAISRNAQALSHLIEDLIDVSRIVTGKLRLELTQVDLVGVLSEALEAHRPTAQAKNVALQFEAEPGIPSVVGDPDRLRQVCSNLISNALKFTPAAGRVDVAVARRGSEVTVTVKDSGIGIAAELLPHVFERFRQGDTTTTRRGGGLGLGLSIVEHVVQRHGGQVTAASDGLGTGATFTMTLPVRAVAPSQRPEARTAEGQRSLVGVRVLVVDDDDDARELLSEVLVEAGAVVSTARSAGEGLSAVVQRAPHVVISDIGMPGEDGYSFIAKMRSLGPPAPWTPALALTAYARAEDKRAALEAGFNAHIGKPVDPLHLVDVVASVVRSPRD